MHSRSFQRPRRRAGQVTATMVPPVSVGEFTIDFFEDDDARSPVEEWMDSDLADLELAALVRPRARAEAPRGRRLSGRKGQAARGRVLRVPHPPYLSRDRAHVHRASSSRQAAKREKILLPVFCHACGTKVVLLLNGYDKAGDPSDKRQLREITLARRRPVEFKERQARERKRQHRGGGRDSWGRVGDGM